MLREEVLQNWQQFKTKLEPVLLTPQEKELGEFLSSSKVSSFLHHGITSNNDLRQLEKDIMAEKVRDKELETDALNNDTLCNYWFCWSNFSSLILEWINLKMVYKLYKDCHHAGIYLYNEGAYCAVCNDRLTILIEEVD